MRRLSLGITSIACMLSLWQYMKYREPATGSQGFDAATPLPPVITDGPAPKAQKLQRPQPSLEQLIDSDPDHYPPWDGYKDKDYDPNHWHFLPL